MLYEQYTHYWFAWFDGFHTFFLLLRFERASRRENEYVVKLWYGLSIQDVEYHICPRVGVQLSCVRPPAWIDMVVVHLKGLLGVRFMLTSLFVHSLGVNIGPS